MSTIASLRQEVDQVHAELYDLLLRRRELTMEIWKLKQEQGEPFFCAEREQQILTDFAQGKLSQKQSTQTQDPLFEEVLRGVMTSILREFEKYLKAQYPERP